MKERCLNTVPDRCTKVPYLAARSPRLLTILEMNIQETGLPGLVLLQPRIFPDERGYFTETYNQQTLEKLGIRNEWVQDNQAASTYGVLRGLHYQRGAAAQAKLVRVLAGSVLDVVVDLRNESPTYGKSYAVELSAENQMQMLVPRGFAHGYAVLSETAVFFYKCDNFYNKGAEGGVRYDDPTLGIDWRIPATSILTSGKDELLPVMGSHSDSGVNFR